MEETGYACVRSPARKGGQKRRHQIYMHWIIKKKIPPYITEIRLPQPTACKIDTRQIGPLNLGGIEMTVRKIRSCDPEATEVGTVELTSSSNKNCDGVDSSSGSSGVGLGLLDDG